MSYSLPQLNLCGFKMNNVDIELQKDFTYKIIFCRAMNICVLQRLDENNMKYLTEISLPLKKEDFIFAGSQEKSKLIIKNLRNFESCDPVFAELSYGIRPNDLEFIFENTGLSEYLEFAESIDSRNEEFDSCHWRAHKIREQAVKSENEPIRRMKKTKKKAKAKLRKMNPPFRKVKCNEVREVHNNSKIDE